MTVKFPSVTVMVVSSNPAGFRKISLYLLVEDVFASFGAKHSCLKLHLQINWTILGLSEMSLRFCLALRNILLTLEKIGQIELMKY